MGSLLLTALKQAIALKQSMDDKFVSIEHLLLAAALAEGSTGQIFSKMNCSSAVLEKAVQLIRGPSKVTTRNPEGGYDALKKYCRDLTEVAAEGKLDPVIGRDVEIRRAIQVLSRRTKNNPVLIGEPGVGKVGGELVVKCRVETLIALSMAVIFI